MVFGHCLGTLLQENQRLVFLCDKQVTTLILS